MIRVTIELYPHGDPSRKQTLHTADIWNDGTGTLTTGNYRASFRDRAGRVYRSATLGGFKRKEQSAWLLLLLLLTAAFHKDLGIGVAPPKDKEQAAQ